MSVYLIDSFEYSKSGDDYVVDIYLNDETGAITFTGNEDPVSEAERGRLVNAIIGLFISDDNNNVYTVKSQLEDPFAYVTTEPNTPENPECNLAFKSVKTTNETVNSGNDGTISVIATTAFTGLIYSIDGVNWDNVGFYSGLAPGDYTIQVKDDNGCSINRNVTILAFDNPLMSTPEEYISTENISRWFAAFNPIVFNFKSNITDKDNFKIEIEITDNTGTISGFWSTNSKGETRADISSYVSTLVNAKDNFKYDVLNWKDDNRSSSFSIRYREVWDGDSSAWHDYPSTLYVTYSAKQIGDQYGGNMAKYVTFFKQNNLEKKAEFLTEFKELTFWSGLPFDVSFIFSENIIGENIKMRTMSLDINRNLVSGQLNNYLLNNNGGFIMAGANDKFIINMSLPPVQNNSIDKHLGINRLMMPGDPGVNVEFFKIQLYRGNDENPYFITKPLVIRTVSPCDSDPYIYLKWINKLGGWDYFRFGHDQSYELNTGNENIIKRNIFDYKTADTLNDVAIKSAANNITFGASKLTLQQVQGLKGLATSIKVMMLTSINPYKWQTVILNTGTFKIYSPKGNFFDLKFSLSLPEINIQKQ